jgi:hypothetical protein
LSRSLVWSGDLATYTYNGFDQIANIVVYYQLVNNDIVLGDDQNELDLSSSLGYSTVTGGPYSGVSTFLTAGYYLFEAAMDDPNYSFATETKEIRIFKADIELYFLSNNVTYNTQTHYISAGTSNSVVNTSPPAQISLFANDVATVTYTYTTDPLGFDYSGLWASFVGAVNAGIYYLKAEILSGDITNGYTNYNVWDNKQATLTINTATITGISLSGGGTYTYDGLVHEVSLTGSSTQYSESVPYLYSMVPTDTAIVYGGAVYENRAKSAGFYVISAVVNGSSQVGYNPNYKTLNLSSNLTIEKAVMYNFTDSSTQFYFLNENITYDGITYFINVKYTNISGLATSNITSLDIRPANSTTFAGDTALVEYWYTTTFGGAYNTTFSGVKNANTYYLKSILKNDNYIEQEYTATFFIDQFDATVVWEGFLDTYTYNGLDQIGSIGAYYTLVPADVSGGESHHFVTLSLEWSSSGNVGTYASIAAFMRAGYYIASVQSDNPNYNFVHGTPTQDLDKEIVINKANVNRFMVNNTLTYDGFTHYISVGPSSINPRDEYATSGTLLGADQATFTYKYKTDPNPLVDYIDDFSGKRDAGTFYLKAFLSITANDHGGSDNYISWPDVNNSESDIATLTIARRQLTISPTIDWSKIYDSTTNSPSFSASNFVVNELSEDESTTHTVTGSYDNKNVGTNKTIIFDIRVISTNEVSNNYFASSVNIGVITVHTLIATDPVEGWTMVYSGSNYFGAVTSFEETPIFHGIYDGDNLTVSAFFNTKNVSSADTINFSLSGTDQNNYYMASINSGVSITKLDVDAFWADTELVYDGTVRSSTSYFNLVGNDRTIENDGKASLIVIFYSDVNHTPGNEISEYRNAGTYYALATINPLDQDLGAEPYVNNYNITISEAAVTCTIAPIAIDIDWYGIEGIEYVYNGEDLLISDIYGTITVVGTDVNIVGSATAELSLEVLKGGIQVYAIRNAGIYTLVAYLDYQYPGGVEMGINYDLGDNNKEVTIEKAEVTNVVFGDGTETLEDSFTYTDGIPYRYFAIPSGGSDYFSSVFSTLYYEYDPAIELVVTYAGGDTTSVGVTGNNAIKNVGTGSYSITGSVIETENYLSWSGTIQVEVYKGDIEDDFFFEDNIITYVGQYVAIFVTNAEGTPNMEEGDVFYEDSTSPIIIYTYLVLDAMGGYVVVDDVVLVYDPIEHSGLDRYSYSAFTNTIARNAQKYYINALISESSNYFGWEGNAILEIEPLLSNVKWEFDNQPINNAVIQFNGYDQFEKVSAYIDAVGSDGINNRISLDITSFSSQDLWSYIYGQGISDYEYNGGLADEFRIAGDYDASSYFDSNDIGSPRYYSQNYNLMSGTDNVTLTMQKYEVGINWYEMGTTDLYDPLTPYVYDGEEHGVDPIGYGLYEIPSGNTYYSDSGLSISVGTLTTDHIVVYINSTYSVFIGNGTDGVDGNTYYVSSSDCSEILIPIVLQSDRQTNAGEYTAQVNRILGGSVAEIVNPLAWSEGSVGSGYLFDYNYILPSESLGGTSRIMNWEIRKRQLILSMDDTASLFKYYDGSSLFRLGETTVVPTIETIEGIDVRDELRTTIAGDGYFDWLIENIVDGDELNINLTLQAIRAYYREIGFDDVEKSNIKANVINILFETFSNANYYLFDIESSQESGVTFEVDRSLTSTPLDPEVILKRPVSMVKSETAGHMYNGLGVDITYDSSSNTRIVTDTILFATMIDVETTFELNELYEGNYFVGRGYISGYNYTGLELKTGVYAKDAGTYDIVIQAGLATEDSEGLANYDVSIAALPVDGVYTITPRELLIKYNYDVQCFDEIKSSNIRNVAVNSINRPLTTVDLSENDFAALLVKDSLTVGSISLTNSWSDNARTKNFYTMYVGSMDNPAELIYINIDDEEDRNNYSYNVPVLQITSIGLTNPSAGLSDYKFTVNDANDISELGRDIEGLMYSKITYGVGLEAEFEYTQTNDIYAISGNTNSSTQTPSGFDGVYYGQGYTIYDIIIRGNPTTKQAGLFGELTGEVYELNLARATVSAGESTFAGSIASKVISGGIISNSSFHGSIYTTYSDSQTVGGIAGFVQDATVYNVKSAGYSYLKVNGDIFAGGIFGQVVQGDGEQCVIFGMESFMEFNISNLDIETPITQVSGLVGQLDSDTYVNGIEAGKYYYSDSALTIQIGSLTIIHSAIYVNETYSTFLGDGTDGEIGVTYYVSSTDLPTNAFLENAININGVVIAENEPVLQGYALTYEEMIADNTDILGMVEDYIYRSCYVGLLNDGSIVTPFNISIYNQLSLARVYGWASFKLSRNVLIPYNYDPESLGEWYYGEGIDLNGKTIYSPKIQVETPLFNVTTTPVPSIIYGE